MPRTRFLVLIAAILGPLAKLMARLWRRLPIHCSRCCLPVAPDSVSPGERMAWCPSCQQVFDVPLLKAPSWVTGVVAILLFNLQ